MRNGGQTVKSGVEFVVEGMLWELQIELICLWDFSVFIHCHELDSLVGL